MGKPTAVAYHVRGMAYERLQQLPEAFTDFSHASVLDPRNASILKSKCKLLIGERRWTDIVSSCNILLNLDPNEVAALQMRGSAYSKLGEFSAAEADFTRAVELSRNDLECAQNLRGRAVLYSTNSQWSKCVRDFQRALELDPDPRRSANFTYLYEQSVSQVGEELIEEEERQKIESCRQGTVVTKKKRKKAKARRREKTDSAGEEEMFGNFENALTISQGRKISGDSEYDYENLFEDLALREEQSPPKETSLTEPLTTSLKDMEDSYLRSIDTSKTFNKRPIYCKLDDDDTTEDTHLVASKVRVVGKLAYSEAFLIGEGSLGTKVYVGLHGEFGNAAIKVLPKCGDSSGREQLLAELMDMEKHMLILISCNGYHRNLVKYLGFEEDERYYYLALELCDFSLFAVYSQDNMLEVRSALQEPVRQKQFVTQLLEGLSFLHSLLIVHGDIRPKNVLFDLNYCVKIADFGLSSKVAFQDDSFTWETSPDGTGGWFAPEVYLNSRKTMAVDMFSAGCVIFWVLTDGHHPFKNNPFRVVQGNYDGSMLLKSPEAFDMCGWMMRKDGHLRPTPGEALQHPFLWSAQERMLYINDVGNKIDQFKSIIESSMVWMPFSSQILGGMSLNNAGISDSGAPRWPLGRGSDLINAGLGEKLSWKTLIEANVFVTKSQHS
jgi:serine/threonine protein kinase